MTGPCRLLTCALQNNYEVLSSWNFNLEGSRILYSGSTLKFTQGPASSLWSCFISREINAKFMTGFGAVTAKFLHFHWSFRNFLLEGGCFSFPYTPPEHVTQSRAPGRKIDAALQKRARYDTPTQTPLVHYGRRDPVPVGLIVSEIRRISFLRSPGNRALTHSSVLLVISDLWQLKSF